MEPTIKWWDDKPYLPDADRFSRYLRVSEFHLDFFWVLDPFLMASYGAQLTNLSDREFQA